MNASVAITREAALQDLLTRAKSANVKDDNAFLSVFRDAKFHLELSDQEIAETLLVSRPTINRWLNGRNLPHPAMRKPIFEWVEERCAEILRRRLAYA